MYILYLNYSTKNNFFVHIVCSQFRYFRISPVFKPVIKKKDTNFRNSIPAAYRLAITFRLLATGDSQLTGESHIHWSVRSQTFTDKY